MFVSTKRRASAFFLSNPLEKIEMFIPTLNDLLQKRVVLRIYWPFKFSAILLGNSNVYLIFGTALNDLLSRLRWFDAR